MILYDCKKIYNLRWLKMLWVPNHGCSSFCSASFIGSAFWSVKSINTLSAWHVPIFTQQVPTCRYKLRYKLHSLVISFDADDAHSRCDPSVNKALCTQGLTCACSRCRQSSKHWLAAALTMTAPTVWPKHSPNDLKLKRFLGSHRNCNSEQSQRVKYVKASRKWTEKELTIEKYWKYWKW